MKHSIRWSLFALPLLAALAACFHALPPGASGTAASVLGRAAQAAQPPIDVTTPAGLGTPVLGVYPAPQVDASAPPEDAPSTF